jgi:uncharacterized repeat protein (TIGR03803 family)
MISGAQHHRGIAWRQRTASAALASITLLQVLLITAQSAQAQTAFTYEVLYTFAGAADGGVPVASLVRDSAGNLYGTTQDRGTSDWGVVFKLDANGKESVLHSFTGGADGATPLAGMILDSAGNLYGTALQGGPPCGLFTCGVVFKIDSTGNETVLHGFTGTDGANPEAGLLRDSAGNLYGTTSAGGSGYGIVFKLDSNYKETTLYTFTGAADGGQPLAGLISDSAGNLYGTTQGGGDFSTCIPDGCGAVFKLDPINGNETVLYTFAGGADGRYPSGDLIQDSAGNLYGTTNAGGASCISSGIGCGVVFKLNPVTGKETVLYAFTGGTDGGQPFKASLFIDNAGILYGTTALGGAPGGCGGGGCGVVFKLDPTTGKETVLYTFTGGADGGQPAAGLIRDSSGNFYGTASTAGISGNCGIGCGVVFRLTSTAFPPDFSLTPTLASLTVEPGGQRTDTITVAPQNGAFGTAIQLSCAVAGPSPMPTCALSPASVTPGANSLTSTLAITAPTAAAMLAPAGRRRLGKSLCALWLALMFGITLVGRSKKHGFLYCVLGALLLLLVLLQMACGGSSNNRVTTQGPKNYTVTVTGASGTIAHTTQVSVTVQ